MGQEFNIAAATLQTLVELSTDGICLVEPDGWRILYANSALSRHLETADSVCLGRDLSEWLPELRSARVAGRLEQVSAGALVEAEFPSRLVAVSEETSAVARVRRVVDQGRTLLAIAVRLETVSTVAGLPTHHRTDPLTGLVDRAFLVDRLTSLLRGDRSGDQCCAVLFVDVDGFKQVNDSYGHLVGDRVLCEVARRLAGCVRSGDHVARFGGDEFVVLLESVCGRNEIEPVIDRIAEAMAHPFDVPQGHATLSASVGFAEASPDGGTAEDLIDAADRAMYAAKRAGSRVS